MKIGLPIPPSEVKAAALVQSITRGRGTRTSQRRRRSSAVHIQSAARRRIAAVAAAMRRAAVATLQAVLLRRHARAAVAARTSRALKRGHTQLTRALTAQHPSAYRLARTGTGT